MVKKKTRAALTRAHDHCRWHYKGKPALLKACREGAKDAIDEARHVSRSLGGVTKDDVVKVADLAISKSCEGKWKTKQYIPICKEAARQFVEEVEKTGTSRDGIIKAANAVSEKCKRFKDAAVQGQYFKICEKSVAGILRYLEALRPGLAGRRRR